MSEYQLFKARIGFASTEAKLLGILESVEECDPHNLPDDDDSMKGASKYHLRNMISRKIKKLKEKDNPQPQPPELQKLAYSIAEFAEMMSLSVSMVNNMIWNGRLKVIRLSGRGTKKRNAIRIPASEIQRIMQSAKAEKHRE